MDAGNVDPCTASPRCQSYFHITEATLYPTCHGNSYISPLQIHTPSPVLHLSAISILLPTGSEVLSRCNPLGSSGSGITCLRHKLCSAYKALRHPWGGAGKPRPPPPPSLLLPSVSPVSAATQMDLTLCSISFDTLSAGDEGEMVFCQLRRYLLKTAHPLARQPRTQQRREKVVDGQLNSSLLK